MFGAEMLLAAAEHRATQGMSIRTDGDWSTSTHSVGRNRASKKRIHRPASHTDIWRRPLACCVGNVCPVVGRVTARDGGTGGEVE